MPTLLPVPAIALGAGSSASLDAHIRSLTGPPQCALAVIDQGIRALGLTTPIVAALSSALDLLVHDQRGSDPVSADIDAAAQAIRDHRAGVVIAIGGGSTLDVAKLAAAVSAGGLPAERYAYCGHPLPPGAPPVIAVPTTAGTGSETTAISVFTTTDGKKAWAWGRELAVRLVILDPELTVSLPPQLTAATGLDALTHALEACTNLNRFNANDLYCHRALALIARHLPEVMREPGNIGAREAMLLASCLAGIGINNAGTAIAHTIAHAIGSLGKVHHGRAAAIGLRASLAWNIGVNSDAFAAAAQALGGPCQAAALPGLVNGLIEECGLDISLRKDLPGITPEKLAAEMAQPSNSAMLKSNARKASAADLLGLAETVLAA